MSERMLPWVVLLFVGCAATRTPEPTARTVSLASVPMHALVALFRDDVSILGRLVHDVGVEY